MSPKIQKYEWVGGCVRVTVVAVGRKSKERKQQQQGLFSLFSLSLCGFPSLQTATLRLFHDSFTLHQPFSLSSVLNLDTVRPVLLLFLDHSHLFCFDTPHLGHCEGRGGGVFLFYRFFFLLST